MDARRHGRRVTPRDDRIDQAVAAAPRDVGVAVAEPAQVGRVVLRGQIDAGVRAGERARLGRLGFEHHSDLRREERVGPEDLARAGGVLNGDEIRVRACRPRRGQLEHARPQGGEDPSGRWHRSLERVEGVETRDHVRVGAGVVRRDLRVTRAQPEQEAALVLVLQAGDGGTEVLGGCGPDADDAAGHRHPLCGGEQTLEVARQAAVEAAR